MQRTIRALALCAAALPSLLALSQREVRGVITRTDPLEWRLLTSVSLGSRIDQPFEALVHCPSDPAAATPVDLAGDVLLRGDSVVGQFSMQEATVYFPIADRSAAHEVNRDSLTAEFLYNGAAIPLRQSLYSHDASGQPVHSGGAYGVWSFGPSERFSPNVVLSFEFEATSWNIAMNEDEARSIAWPTGDWPAEAQQSLEPMLFIDRGFDGDYDRAAIERIVREWTADSPTSQPPVVLAKWIAGQLANSFQPSGRLVSNDSIAGNSVQPGRSLGAVQGLNATRLDEAAESMAGTPLDLALLLTALYREAGLPARIVIGYVAGDEGGRVDTDRRRDEPELGMYAWVEFALYDETQSSLADALTWVPVDILAMRAGNVGRRSMDQRWDGFGRSDYFNQIIPLGYHLHPHELPAVSYGMADARSGSGRTRGNASLRRPAPSLWGWNVVPVTPGLIHQTIVLSATTPSRTAEDVRRERAGRGQ